jgi:hypothetical protein
MHKPTKKLPEAGEGELGTFAIVAIACGLLSGAIFAFDWFKDTKDGRLDARRQLAIDKHKPKQSFATNRDPNAYYVSCKKSLWQALQRDVSCTVAPYSYGELDFLSYEYE